MFFNDFGVRNSNLSDRHAKLCYFYDRFLIHFSCFEGYSNRKVREGYRKVRIEK
jgi:hypothetical protein